MSEVSRFAVRGVIEGFYGKPWSHEQRLDMIEFIADRGMNTFVYSPKDDPLVRLKWRQPYSGEQLERLAELVDACGARDVRFIYCVSPGLSMLYASDTDRSDLLNKILSVSELGVRDFGLLLDDIPMDLQHSEDREVFDSLVEAHVDLVNFVYGRLAPDATLIICPTVYCGYGDEAYVKALGRGIDPRIEMFWTGRTICSTTIDLYDAATFARSAARPATYWDNYPVNDVAMTDELHIGPYRGRDPHLYRFATGIIANGMELFESSKIAFASIADYLDDPEGYDPEDSWMRAIRDIAGDQDFDEYLLFADNVRFSCLTEFESPKVSAALDSFMFRTRVGAGGEAAVELKALADAMISAADHLLRDAPGNPALISESRPWILKFAAGARAIQRIAILGAEGRLASDGPAELHPYLTSLREMNVHVFGAAIDMVLEELVKGSFEE
jgi:hyaluronoglucosaminidase